MKDTNIESIFLGRLEKFPTLCVCYIAAIPVAFSVCIIL